MTVRVSLAVLAVLGTLATSSQAETFLMPPDRPETGGVSTGLRNAPRTYMALYMPTNFSSLTQPVMITGMQFRLAQGLNTSLGASWPAQPLTFSSFDVQLSQATASVLSAGEFASATANFASQQAAGTVVPVRSGALTIATDAYLNTPVDSPFGPVISFSTPYRYNPGESLALYMTHTGYFPSLGVQPFFAATDSAVSNTDALGSTLGYQAATATDVSRPYIVQFTMAPVPEPASMLMLAAGVAGLLTLSRRRQASTLA